MKTETAMLARGHAVRGVALLEVLVALVLCSVGLIGSGAFVLQHMATQRALEHDQFARDQLHDMARSLRAARPPASGLANADDRLPPAVMANFRVWQATVGAGLPGGHAALLRFPGDEPGAWRLEIRWHESSVLHDAEPSMRQVEALVLP